ncbi:MauE/DoxX family redox-associated membrane protein [uncultured Formosa sp.]|uniref:MauE/DoxX family redox-associated membrane protein n=1 Tax=uncultured Formosa sp. TaxID=255435 RepID=UPI002623201A|nr:MauE/DoxX family redox-associated membrane protein [uncultured Formosa sp.]
MKWIQKHTLQITECISISFILLFVYAAVSKLLEYHKFRVQLIQSDLLAPYADTLVWFIPLLELTLALLLLFPKYRLYVFYGCFSLMISFTIYIWYLLNYSDHVPCACGGIINTLSWNEHLVFNFMFIILGGIGICFSLKKYHKIDYVVRGRPKT